MRTYSLVSVLILCGMAAGMAVDNEPALRAVTSGAERFSTNFFKAASEVKSGNLICSPLSVNIVLSMISHGGKDKTLQELRDALHLPADEALVQSGYRSLIDTLNNESNVELRVANKVFTSDRVNVKQPFLDIMMNVYRSPVQKLDFTKSAEAAQNVNGWCEENTNHRIKDLVKSDDFDAQTVMVLVNAIYFKGQWAEKFDPKFTHDMTFHVNENVTKQVPAMFKSASFRHGTVENLNARFIELPYKGNEFKLVIIVPNEINGLASLHENLHKININDVLKSGYKSTVDLYLPKFKIESELDLKPILQSMGIRSIFDDSANFSELADVPTKVSKAIQKAFIEVNEEGSEAAAATGFVSVLLSSVTTLRDVFRIDKPFVFQVIKVDRKEQDVKNILSLFTGLVKDVKTDP